MRSFGLIALAALGCGSDKAAVPAGAGSGSGSAVPTEGSAIITGPAGAAAPNGFDKLRVTVDGQRVAMQRGFIKRVSPDQWRIQVGDVEGSCDELLSGVTNRQPGGVSFVASIGRRIRPDGSDTVVVTDFWSAGHPTESVTSTAAVSGTADRGSQTFVTLAKITDIDKTRKLEVDGSFTATGCGDQARPEVGLPKAQHPTTATLTLAGRKLPVLSAVRDGEAITLTSGPRDCSPPTVAAQAILRHRAGQWELSGTWFAQPSVATDNAVNEADRPGDLKVSPGELGDSADGPTVALALSGAGKLGDYGVALSGTIEALDCRAAPASRHRKK